MAKKRHYAFCGFCGVEWDDGQYCGECGADLNNQPSPYDPPAVRGTQRSEKNYGIMIFAIVVSFCLFISFIAPIWSVELPVPSGEVDPLFNSVIVAKYGWIFFGVVSLLLFSCLFCNLCCIKARKG